MVEKMPRYTEREMFRILANYILKLETAMPIPLEDKIIIEQIADGNFCFDKP